MRDIVQTPIGIQGLYMEDLTDLVKNWIHAYYEDWADLDTLALLLDNIDVFLDDVHDNVDHMDYGEFEYEKMVFQSNYCKYVRDFIIETQTYIEDLRAGKVTEENIGDYDSKINQAYDNVIDAHNKQIDLNYGGTNIFFDPTF